jgi:hypothetical protein
LRPLLSHFLCLLKARSTHASLSRSRGDDVKEKERQRKQRRELEGPLASGKASSNVSSRAGSAATGGGCTPRLEIGVLLSQQDWGFASEGQETAGTVIGHDEGSAERAPSRQGSRQGSRSRQTPPDRDAQNQISVGRVRPKSGSRSQKNVSCCCCCCGNESTPHCLVCFPGARTPSSRTINDH